MAKFYAIVIDGHSESERGYEELCKSSRDHGNEFDIQRFSAVTPEFNAYIMDQEEIEWNYPWDKRSKDQHTGLLKHPYKTKNPEAKISCALSHYLLWKMCKEENEPFFIFEHDSIFIRKLDNIDLLMRSDFEIIGINSPIGATRRASLFATMVQNDRRGIQPVPKIDTPDVPQGIAGGSAYLMKPNKGATVALNAVNRHGLWHNDALLCYQVVGDDILGVSRTWYTTINKSIETTTR